MIDQRRPTVEMSPYRETIDGLLRLHQLTVDGQDESAEYHGLCAALEHCWNHMTPVEQERTGGLSQDLYSVSDPPPTALEPMTSETHGYLQDAHEARALREWDLALSLLRKLDKFVPAELLAYLRGTIWEGLDEDRVAVVFHQRAHELAPAAPFLARFLNVLERIDIDRAVTVAAPILDDIDKYDGNVVVQAVEVLYRSISSKPTHEEAPEIHKLITILKRLYERAKSEPSQNAGPYPRMTLFLLATLNRTLGKVREAYGYYSQLLMLEPRNDLLLVSRGALVYGSDSSAISDFEQAVKLRSRVVWPYYYLAHHLLRQRRYEESLQMCQRGLDKPMSPSVESSLHEFSAISMSALGFPAHLVQRTFEEAMRVDPSNERAAENLRRYLAAIAVNQASTIDWEYASEASVQSVGQQLYTPPTIEPSAMVGVN